MRKLSAAALVLAAVPALAQSVASLQTAPAAPATPIRDYIRNGWQTLSRSMSECKSVVDLKVTTTPILYLPAGMETPAAVTAMQQQCHVEVRQLPKAIHILGDIKPTEIPAEGLLYLPNRYVVPGGRFNEMYGWDSYFILLGLVHDHQSDLARGMVENFFFEIENYGAVLNANRTYFFSRSQPPFLTSMIREIYEAPASPEQVAGPDPSFKPSDGAPKRAGTLDPAWLAHAYAMAQRDYALWTSPIHTAGTTGLSRYHDLGEGPVPEMADDSSYYPDVLRYLLAHPTVNPEYLVLDSKDAAVVAQTSCDTATSKVCAAAVVQGHRLSAAYFRGDRADRESGFDTTFRWGAFSGSADQFAPICLNALLFKYEKDMAHFATLLKRPAEAAGWEKKAAARRAAIDKYLWNEAAGEYFDYNFVTKQQSTYKYVTTFYPLWAGLASTAQAAAVERHLADFERPAGLAMSTTASGVQWDQPFGWAPENWLAVAGLEKAGFHTDATRIARAFSGVIEENYAHDGTMREKYNVVSGSGNVAVAAGYKSNVVGFGWTNGVYLKLQDLLSPGVNRVVTRP